MFLDTQLVSYAHKGHWHTPRDDLSISSIVANEFLLVHGPKPNQANYYVPHPTRIHHTLAGSQLPFRTGMVAGDRRTHPFKKHLTDSMVMEFGPDHAPIVEYGNRAISQVITLKMLALYREAIYFLGKDKRKLLLARFGFLIDHSIRCEPISKTDVHAAFALLSRFKAHHNPKKTFRNTWNDMLILAAAATRGASLRTMDSELTRFAAELFTAGVVSSGGFLTLNFPGSSFSRKHSPHRESKGFINTGWAVQFRRQTKEPRAKE